MELEPHMGGNYIKVIINMDYLMIKCQVVHVLRVKNSFFHVLPFYNLESNVTFIISSDDTCCPYHTCPIIPANMNLRPTLHAH